MFLIRTPDGHVEHEHIDQTIALLEDLHSSYRILRQHGRPTKALLKDAPVLDAWHLTPCWNYRLSGLVNGHPRLVGTDRAITTSDLWLFAPDHGWARTWSRWYRLGSPAPQRTS